MTPTLLHISSRDNPSLALVRRVQRDPAAYKGKGRRQAAGEASTSIWLEGDHLLRACLARGRPLQQALIAASAWEQPALRSLALRAQRVLLLPDALFKELSALESPAAIGALIARPEAAPLGSDVATVILDRLQDAGNVGSIVRSAAALGVKQVLALKGTAALWSPKVLRAGMGAHFALQLHEALSIEDLQSLQLPWLATSSHAAALLHRTVLPQPCAWVFGHEGQGVCARVASRCAFTLRIAQPGGEESLNVAAAAAICLHESLRQQG
ncbi:MAG: TrmH family RNA methyltransferase [Rubrivivax sp.]